MEGKRKKSLKVYGNGVSSLLKLKAMNLRIVLSSWSVTLWHDKIFLWKSRLKKNYLEYDNLVFQFSNKCFDQTGNNDDR